MITLYCYTYFFYDVRHCGFRLEMALSGLVILEKGIKKYKTRRVQKRNDMSAFLLGRRNFESKFLRCRYNLTTDGQSRYNSAFFKF